VELDHVLTGHVLTGRYQAIFRRSRRGRGGRTTQGAG